MIARRKAAGRSTCVLDGMIRIELTLLDMVAVAGIGYMLGAWIVRRLDPRTERFIPEPLVGGLLLAAALLAARLAGLQVSFPVQGRPVDFLVALLTTNMGLHITPKILRQGIRLFVVFFGAGLALFFVQLTLVFPVMLLAGADPRAALLYGPISFVGAPFNLNPPSQLAPIADLFPPTFAPLEAQAQGSMMLGVLAGAVLAGVLGRQLFKRAGERPPQASPVEQRPAVALAPFATGETFVLVLVLGIVAAAFALHAALLRLIPSLTDDILPVIVLGYLLGAAFRLLFESRYGTAFPEQELTVVLLGPTMSLVLTYAIASIPLYQLRYVTPIRAIAALLAVGSSALLAWLLFPILARATNRYYAAVIATAFLAITTGWGPVGMAYLRRLTDVEGPVEPMPVVLPLNAFFVFPWMVILLTRLVVWAAG